MESDNSWHLDKKVPVAVIVFLLMQTVTLVWWAGTLTQRVATLEEISKSRQTILERMTRIETTMEYLVKTADKNEDTLKKIEGLLKKEK